MGQSGADFQAVIVKPGDTLWSIAHRYLKDPARWDEILKYNKLPTADPTVALPGMQLRVPMRLIKEELRAAHLVARRNQVFFRRTATAEWKPGSDNMELFRNDWIRTMDDSGAEVQFLDHGRLQLGANAMAVIKPVNKDYAAELKSAGTYIGRAKIMTASAVVTPKSKDTQYVATVRDDLSTKVEVLKGEAEVAADGQTVSVTEGMLTEVQIGLAPSAPSTVPDMAELRTRVAAHGMLLPTKMAMRGRLPAAAPAAAAVPADTMAGALQNLKLGEAVSGYRVQCSDNPDMSELLTSKNLDVDQTITAEALGIPPGRHWCRVAVLDLLGVLGKFSQPKQYSLK